MRFRTVAATALIIALAACSAGDSAVTSSGGATTTTQPGSTTTQSTGTELPEWFQNENAAPQSLVDVIGTELDADYVGSMAVDWNSGAIGCSSGGDDLQVITPGYVIFFEEGGKLLRIHAAENGRWLECDFARALDGLPVLTS